MRLIAEACNTPDEEHARGTPKLLAGRVGELGLAESISPETVRSCLKKNHLKPWQKREWCTADASGDVFAARQDVLDLYCEPATGQREAWVTERRTKVDFVQAMERLVQTHPHVEVIRVVMDNLNTRKPGLLHDTFPPDQANALLKKLEWHHMPKHGSWLNMAEIEFAALTTHY